MALNGRIVITKFIGQVMTPEELAKELVKKTTAKSVPRWIWAGTGAYAFSWVVRSYIVTY